MWGVGGGAACFPPPRNYLLFFYKMNERPDRRERKIQSTRSSFSLFPSLFDGSRLGGGGELELGRRIMESTRGRTEGGLIFFFFPLVLFFLFFWLFFGFL